MKVFLTRKEHNNILSPCKVFNVVIVRFTYISTKGKGRRISTTKVLVTHSKRDSENKAHFRKWAEKQGFKKALLIEWDNVGIAYLGSEDFNPLNFSQRVLRRAPHLSYLLGKYQPNQWLTDIKVTEKTIRYSYTTVRAVDKEYFKNIFCFDDEKPEDIFYLWVKEFNSNFKFKELRNVKILCDSYKTENAM